MDRRGEADQVVEKAGYVAVAKVQPEQVFPGADGIGAEYFKQGELDGLGVVRFQELADGLARCVGPVVCDGNDWSFHILRMRFWIKTEKR